MHKVKTPFFTIFKANKKTAISRVGISIAKKHIKLAVHRNKIKRMVHGSFMRKKNSSYDYVILFKSSYEKIISLDLNKIW